MRTVRPKIGGFVRVPDEYGIGKLVAVEGNRGRVRFRHSAVVTEEHLYPLRSLERGFLSPQMRVFWYDSTKMAWRAGRVTDYFVDGEYIRYTVRFPNGVDRDIPETELETRSLLPNQDPSAALADGWFETQYFYDRRLAALRTLIHARGASWGITGLTSASVHLLPHQVEVVRRVLSDPIQRYLLADEVGLGKTIEAGAIIRQCLLDSRDDKVLVLAPESLVRQWERELREKFAVDEFPGRMAVRPFAALADLQPNEFEALVIDEAHHLVGRQETGDASAQTVEYQRLVQLAHSSRRLFILSATPVLSDEDAMLRLLHLLDPYVHRLEDREAFRKKLANRQEYGRLLMALDPEAPPFILKRLGTQLLESFPDDEMVVSLATKFVNRSFGTEEEPSGVVRSLKRHISETYRLHQRLLRTRRKDLQGWELLPRTGQVDLIQSPGLAADYLWSHLEDWRYRSLVAAHEQGDPGSRETMERAFGRRYLRLFETMAQSPGELAVELERQQGDVVSGREPSFGEEEEIVHSLRLTLDEILDPEMQATFTAEAVQRVLGAVSRPITGAPKAVVFTSSSAVAVRLAAQLQNAVGSSAVGAVLEGSSADGIEEAVKRVRSSRTPAVLVCDKSGEEGLNLHFVDVMVHLDLPLAPARLEQRIGRVDRFGRQETSIRHVVLLPSTAPDSPWFAWHVLLRDGFQIYDRSISDVQFLLEGMQEQLALTLYRQGVDGLVGAVEWVQQELEKERTRLDEQYALDQLAVVEEESGSAFEALEEADAPSFYQNVDRWLVETLQLRRRREPQMSPQAFRLQWSERTLMPRNPWEEVFGPALGRVITYDRTVAVNHSGVRLIRPGSRLVEALHRHLLWDDRGTSFATWRQDPRWNTAANGEWMGFQLTYVVEFDLERLIGRLNREVDPGAMPAIRRRVDALFPPWIEILTLDTFLQEVADPLIVEILQPQYKESGGGQQDYNLGSRRQAMFTLIPPDHFSDLCKKVRERSEELVWSSPGFRRAVEGASQRARSDLLTRNQLLRRRNEILRRMENTHDPTLEQEIAINQAIVETVERPRVRLDAIGFYIISDQPPEGSGA